MRNAFAPQEDPLEAAAAAWTEQVRGSSISNLASIHACIQSLRRLVEFSHRYRELDPQAVCRAAIPAAAGALDPVRALRELTQHLQYIEKNLGAARLALEQAADTGAELAREFEGLDAQISGRPESRADTWTPYDPADGAGADYQLLVQLIDAQRAEIAALQARVAAQDDAGRQGGTNREQTDSVLLHNVLEFLEDSPITEDSARPSHYHRLLAVAGSSKGQRVPMGEILTLAGLISERQLSKALDHQHVGQRRPLGMLLVDLGYLNEEAIAQALAAQLSLPFVALEREFVREGALSKVPIHLARRHICFPITFNDHALTVAMANPLDLVALEDLHLASGMHIRPCVAARGEIRAHIALYYA